MNMKRLKLFSIAISLLLSQGDIFAWGRCGHDAVAYIAECHLTPKARRNLQKYIGNQSLPCIASWMDYVRDTPEFSYTAGWHCMYFDENYEPVIAEEAPLGYKDGMRHGDCLYGLVSQILPVLENRREYSDSVVAINIRLLCHIIGDMHCPSHIRWADHKGFKIEYCGKRMKYHGFWDSGLLDNMHHNWSFLEYQKVLDTWTPRQIREAVAGSVVDWAKACSKDCRPVVSRVSGPREISRAEAYEMISLAENQIRVGGYRLAAILNRLFGE